MNDLYLVVDGQKTTIDQVRDDLARAVLISLFTWRRANPDDKLPSTQRYGWWGDSYAIETNDRIGSRLWLLSRSTLTNSAALRAREYARESLQWLLDDGVATALDVLVERVGISQLSLGVTLTRGDLSKLNIRFADVWSVVNAV